MKSALKISSEFETFQPALINYIESLKGYQKNKFTPPAPEVRERIATAWARSFERWGYEK